MTSATEHEAAARRPLRILSVSCVYPTAVEPRRGVFIQSRLLALATFAKLSIVAPVGLVQWGTGGARRWGASNPSQRSDGGVHVLHPRWLYPPNAGWANGFLLFMQVLPVLLRLRRRFRWEVIDAHYGHPEGVAAALSAMVFRCRYTVTLRGAEVAHVRHRLRRRLLGWSLRRAARVIALSGELRELALALGVPRQRIVVVTNGVDGDLFRPRPRDESRARLGLDPRLRLVLTVGRQVAEKGHLHVLDAMRPLFDGDPELRLAIAGGPGRTGSGFERELRRRLDSPQLGARVMLLGEIAQDELAVWMNAAEVFCLGSLREGCPNVVLEALACGVPVVATKVGAVPELVPSEEFGLVVPAADPAALERALRRALAGNWDRAAISAWGRSRSWLHVAEELRAVFTDVSESA